MYIHKYIHTNTHAHLHIFTHTCIWWWWWCLLKKDHKGGVTKSNPTQKCRPAEGISKRYNIKIKHINTFLGVTEILSIGKLVSPPSSTSERYKKNVNILGPQAKAVSAWSASWWAVYLWPNIYMRARVYVCVCMSVYICVSVCIWIFINMCKLRHLYLRINTILRI
jgi:hypothetical protein